MKTASTRPVHRVVAVVVIGFMTACRASEPSVTSSPVSIPAEPPAPVSIRPAPTPTIVGDPFQKGLDKAASAGNLAQSAQTQDDWNLVVSQWQRAIDYLQDVPKSSPDYPVAQKLLPDYRRSLAKAEQQAKRGSNNPSVGAKPKASTDAGIPLIAGRSPATLEENTQEPIEILNSLNQQQADFFTNRKKFASNAKELGNTVADSSNYTYRILSPRAKQAMSTAVARKEQLPSYTGAVFVVKDDKNNEITQTIVCVTQKPSKTPPAMPQLIANEIKCPAGSNSL